MCEGPKPEKAAAPLELQQRGLVPKVITYPAVISALEKGQKPEQVVELPAEMLEKRLAPDVITYNALISTCTCFFLLPPCLA